MLTAAAIVIVNAAATELGEDPIASTADAVPIAVIADANYDRFVDAELSRYPWRFAERWAELDRLAADPLDTEWAAAYSMPAGAMRITNVLSGGCELDWKVAGREIWLRDGIDKPACAYVARPEESEWPGYFREIIIARMKVAIYRWREDEGAAQAAEDRADNLLTRTARNRDSQQSTPAPVMRSRLLGARFSA